MRAIIVTLSLALASTAAAGPFKERLTKDQVDAAVKAVQSRLTVDKAVAAKCSELPTDTTKDKSVSAACFRVSGNLGLAITLWKVVATEDDKALELEATRQLGPAHEAAAIYDQAAKWYDTYARMAPKDKDADVLLIRAICIYRQLDDVDAAERGFKFLKGHKRKGKGKLDANTLCDNVRPIVVPAAAP